GDGRFSGRVLSSQDGVDYSSAYQLVTGDFNGDGRTDYLLHRLSNVHESNVYFGLGDGRFSGRVLSSQDGVDYSSAYRLLTGDFNGDGNLDYMLHRYAGVHETNVYLGVGDGTFSGRVLSSQDGVDYPSNYQLETGDFNG